MYRGVDNSCLLVVLRSYLGVIEKARVAVKKNRVGRPLRCYKRAKGNRRQIE